MRKPSHLLICFAAFTASASAGAQSATDTKQFAVIGTVPTMCSVGAINGDDGIFDLGVLINTSTGLLRSDLAAPDKVLIGSFCSSKSSIEVAATPMAAQDYTAAPPNGFSRTVNYTATASGWTAIPAVYDTAAFSNIQATQIRPTPFAGDVTIGLSDFKTAGGDTLKLVADPEYRGLVTVTITAAD